ncbi:MAG: hypothetical protein WAV31_03380 [Candidatus Moraniibacteriota bacterium]
MSSIHGWKNGVAEGRAVGSELTLARKEILNAGNFDYLTSYTYFHTCPPRIRGEYRIGSSVGTLDYINKAMTKSVEYKLIIEFTDLDEALVLYNLIRGGKIWPVINYEDPQVPSPCRHLKDIFREGLGIIRREIAKKLHFA